MSTSGSQTGSCGTVARHSWRPSARVERRAGGRRSSLSGVTVKTLPSAISARSGVSSSASSSACAAARPARPSARNPVCAAFCWKARASSSAPAGLGDERRHGRRGQARARASRSRRRRRSRRSARARPACPRRRRARCSRCAPRRPSARRAGSRPSDAPGREVGADQAPDPRDREHRPPDHQRRRDHAAVDRQHPALRARGLVDRDQRARVGQQRQPVRRTPGSGSSGSRAASRRSPRRSTWPRLFQTRPAWTALRALAVAERGRSASSTARCAVRRRVRVLDAAVAEVDALAVDRGHVPTRRWPRHPAGARAGRRVERRQERPEPVVERVQPPAGGDDASRRTSSGRRSAPSTASRPWPGRSPARCWRPVTTNSRPPS